MDGGVGVRAVVHLGLRFGKRAEPDPAHHDVRGDHRAGATAEGCSDRGGGGGELGRELPQAAAVAGGRRRHRLRRRSASRYGHAAESLFGGLRFKKSGNRIGPAGRM